MSAFNIIKRNSPNLDACVTVEEMRYARHECAELASGFNLLASYAEAKADAMQCRLDGKIDLALKFEAACDSVYGRLPGWAKW